MEVHRKLRMSKQEYAKHIASQIDLNRFAIMGDVRNWQQSYLAQDAILRGAKLVLDVGCGKGYWTKRINDLLTDGKCIGIDICEEFVNQGIQEFGVDLRVMDMHDMTFDNDIFDVVYADNIVEHSPKAKILLAVIYRVLKPGGKLVVLIPPDKRGFPQYQCEDHVLKADIPEVKFLVEGVGFTNVRITDIDTKKLGMADYLPAANAMLLVEAWKKAEVVPEGAEDIEVTDELHDKWVRVLWHPEKRDGLSTVEAMKMLEGELLEVIEKCRTLRYDVLLPTFVKDMELESQKGKKVLDVGTGAGHDAIMMAKNGADVTVTDIIEENLEFIKRYAKLHNVSVKILPWVEFVNRVDEHKCEFDLVYASGSLHHMPNIEQILHCISVVLKHNGRLLSMFYAVKMMGWKEGPYTKVFTEEEVRQILHDSGFGDIGYVLFHQDNYAKVTAVKVIE